MSRTVAELLEHALNLPEADRAELADLIAASLAPLQTGSLHPAWGAKLCRRATEVDTGQVRPIAWDEVRREVQSDLDTPGFLDG